MKIMAFFGYVASLGMSVLLLGCAGSISPKPEELVAKNYVIYEGSSEKISLSKPDLLIKRDGSLHLANDEVIMDEEGAILNAIRFGDKLFYVVNNQKTKTMKLKDNKGLVIKSFEESFRTREFHHNGKLYIATVSEADARRYSNYVFSNLFEFDGNTVKLIKKNVVIDGQPFAGLDTTAKLSEYDMKVSGSTLGNDYEWKFYTIVDGQRNDIKPSLVPINGYTSSKKKGYEYSFIVGFVGDTALYIYDYKFNNNDGKLQRKTILEAQNLTTGQVAILLDDGQAIFSLLTNGKDVVFKQGNRLIDLRTLKSANIDKNFFPIQAKTGYKNMGGGINWSTFDEYSSDKLANANGLGKNLFFKE